jgi:hypothetical protein
VKEMKLLIQGKLEKSVLGKGTEVACKHWDQGLDWLNSKNGWVQKYLSQTPEMKVWCSLEVHSLASFPWQR